MKNGKGIFPGRLWLATLFSIGLLAPQLASAAGSTPSITTQPVSQIQLAGTNATFFVVASGQGTLLYQWSLNGTNLTDGAHINGATNDTLIINDLMAEDAGDYQVTVSNSHGSVTSSNATLTVLLPAAITGQPTNQSVVLSSNASFTVSATGTGTLSYQWQLNGSPLSDGGRFSGTTNSTLNIANVQTNDAGSYQVLVSNAYGSVTSSVTALNVLIPPSIATSPTNQRILVGGNVSFSASATGTQPLFYQWQKNGVSLTDGGSISGSTNSTMTITGLQFSDDGAYSVVVSNAYGVAISAAALLSVATNLPPLSGSIGVWGDFDNDGLMDVLLAGDVQGVTNIPDGRFTRLYHNAGRGIFDDTGSVFPQLDNVSAAWGDLDNDGRPDLLLSGLADGTNGPVSVTEVYRNDGSNNFTRLNLGLEPVAEGSVAWVDYDNDGRLDIFETGYDTSASNWVAQIYHNNGDGTFTLAVTNLPVLQTARGYWGDYDNDGRPDLLLSGSGTSYLLHNDGGGRLSNSGVTIPANNVVVAPWGDYDGDGRLDFITSPTTVSVVFGPDYHPTLYHNEGGGAFSTHLDNSLDMWLFNAQWGDIDNSGRACLVVSGWVPLVPGGGVWSSATKVYIYLGSSWQEVFTLGGWDNFSEDWVDYNGDGKLDIFTTGGGLTTFWNNNVAFHLDFPQPPLNPAVAFTGLDGVIFSWQSPANTPTTGRGLSYSVRVGHTPGGVDVVSPMSDPATGRRLIPTLGNAGEAHQFMLTNLPPGNYYWAVQSIGQSYTGSPFTADGMFTVTSSPPVVVTQPTNTSVLSGDNATFAAYIIGTKPLSYQWRNDGQPLTDNGIFSGSTSPTLVVSNSQPNLDGNYDLVITNNYGSVTSAVAVLYVNGEPRIFTQPTNQSIILGSNTTLAATAVGTAPLNYQWWFNGMPMSDGGRISGSTTVNLNIENVQTNNAGFYQLVVTNNYGSVTSSVAALTVLIPATIASQPINQFVLVNSNASFSVSATGTTPLNYLWYSNGVALVNGGRISGATSATLTISGTQTNDSGGTYQVVVTNNYGSTTSSVATLTVLAPVQIAIQPSSQAALLNSNVSFAVTATGTGPLNYQWYFNGSALNNNGHISGSDSPNLTIFDVQNSDAGGYVAVVTNLLSSAKSLMASLTPQSVLAPSVRYVALNSTNPSPPYLDWATAATNIQDAIDAAVAGDSVMVDNGIYNYGGRFVYGTNTSNRVVINKPVLVQSVNGSAATTIIGYNTSPAAYHPGRCAYLTNGASLAGFTLMNGGAGTSGDPIRDQSGGGIWCESSDVTISNCVLNANVAPKYYGGGAFGGTLISCLLTNNSAGQGGGACSNMLLNCTLTRNTTSVGLNLTYGGGAYGCQLTNCLLVGNQSGNGGGAAGSTMLNCVVSNNAASYGGGMYQGMANNSLLSSNRAFVYGGGAYYSALNNCLLRTNLASRSGGGAFGGALINCTVIGNSAAGVGGVNATDNGGVIANSIIYDNIGANLSITKSIFNVCSIPVVGPGCFTNAPNFVNEAGGDFHLSSNSPCINSGNNAYVSSSTDLDGNPRIVGGTVDIGCYEYQSPTSVISYAWLQQYGLPTDGSVDHTNLNGTSFSVYQDWIAGLNPTNPASVLAMQTPAATNNFAGIIVTWQSVSGITYYLQRSSDLTQPFSVIQSNLIGQAGITSYTDTSATNSGPYFYRVGVQ